MEHKDYFFDAVGDLYIWSPRTWWDRLKQMWGYPCHLVPRLAPGQVDRWANCKLTAVPNMPGMYRTVLDEEDILVYRP
jgi:hypothetical protein